MSKHKWYDVILALAEGKAVQCKYPEETIWNDFDPDEYCSPLDSGDYKEWRVKPKEPIKKYKVAYCTIHTEFEYEGVSNCYYLTVEDFTKDNPMVKWAVLLEPTMKEFYV